MDYMGSSILMGVFSNADLKLQDEWKVNLSTVETSLSEKRYSGDTVEDSQSEKRYSCTVESIQLASFFLCASFTNI